MVKRLSDMPEVEANHLRRSSRPFRLLAPNRRVLQRTCLWFRRQMSNRRLRLAGTYCRLLRTLQVRCRPPDDLPNSRFPRTRRRYNREV